MRCTALVADLVYLSRWNFQFVENVRHWGAKYKPKWYQFIGKCKSSICVLIFFRIKAKARMKSKPSKAMCVWKRVRCACMFDIHERRISIEIMVARAYMPSVIDITYWKGICSNLYTLLHTRRTKAISKYKTVETVPAGLFGASMSFDVSKCHVNKRYNIHLSQIVRLNSMSDTLKSREKKMWLQRNMITGTPNEWDERRSSETHGKIE